MKTSLLLSLTSALFLGIQAQERPTPAPAPDYIPEPPPSLAEVTPFPSNTDGRVAIIAHLYDPRREVLIISLDSQSSQTFTLERSHDLLTWAATNQTKQGNRSIITFFAAIDETAPNAYYRVVKE